MKNFIWTAALILSSLATALSQNSNTGFYITIADESQIISIEQVGDYTIPIFQNASINGSLKNFVVYDFA